MKSSSKYPFTYSPPVVYGAHLNMIRIALALLFTMVSVSSWATCSGISAYSTTASANNGSSPCFWATGLNPADVKLVGRQKDADIRSWYMDSQWVNPGFPLARSTNTELIVSDTNSGIYQAARRLKLGFSDYTGNLYGTIVSTSYSTPSTTMTVSLDSGTISSTLNKVFFGAVSPNNSSVVSSTLGLDVIGTPYSIISGTSNITANNNNGISVTVGGIRYGSITTAGWTVSGALIVTGTGTVSTSGIGSFVGLSSGDITTTGVINGASLISTSSGGTVSASVGNFGTISASSLNGYIGGTLLTSLVPIQIAVFNGNGSCTKIGTGYNFASCTRVSAGKYGVSPTNNFSDGNYSVNCNAENVKNQAYPQVGTLNSDISASTTGFIITTGTESAGNADNGRISCLVYKN